MNNDIKISKPPTPNFVIGFGGGKLPEEIPMEFIFTVKKTIVNRFKYWMLCQFFPFKIQRWE